LAPTLQAFFTDRLARQRQASPHTVAAYRDTFKLLLTFAERTTRIPPSRLQIADLDAPLIGAFLDHLERERGNSVRTRNARLAALHSLFRYAALRHPEHAAVIARVLAIPPKRFDRTIVTYLTEPEINALLAAPDQSTWTGRRDHALLALAVQTGLRASELISLTVADAHLGTGAHISCVGKGRKQRITPLTAGTVTVLNAWPTERAGLPADPLFPTRRGTPLSRDALERRVAKHANTATVLPDPRREERLPARHAALRCHASAQRRRGHHRHRSLARTRNRCHHTGLRPRRPRTQRTCPRPNSPNRHHTTALPALRHDHRLPRRPLNYADHRDHVSPPPRAIPATPRHNHQVHIRRVMPRSA
jgi:site-specific recombinase XerD